MVVAVGFVIDEIALPVGRRRMRWEGCGVSTCATAVPVLPSGQILPITHARGIYEWGNTREGWEGGDGVVWSNSRRARHGCELL
jgi:hypothetical protein